MKNYNETDAAAFVHENVLPAIKAKYTVDQIEYLLDLIYEYYESAETDSETDIMEMTAYINANIKQNYCMPVTHEEIAQLLDADNLYMESIGLIEPEQNDDDLVYLHKIINDIYMSLSDELKKKYTKDDIYVIILIEWDYLDATEDTDETEMYSYIQQKATEKGISISIDEIEEIAIAEENFLLED